MKNLRIGLLSILIVSLCGCTIIQPVEPQTGHYYLNPGIDFASIGKVAFLELENLSSRPEQTEQMSQSLADSLGKKHLFSVRRISRLAPEWHALELDSISEYTYEQLAQIREQLGVDAILFGTLCRYSPYPHFLTHLQLKMIHLRDGALVWAMEEVWDSTDKKTAQRMQQYFREQMRGGYDPINWQITLNSPRVFSRFVAFEATQTLPATLGTSVPSSEKSGLFSMISIE